MTNTEFVECAVCAAVVDDPFEGPSTTCLCESCLANRNAICELRRENLRLFQVIATLRAVLELAEHRR